MGEYSWPVRPQESRGRPFGEMCASVLIVDDHPGFRAQVRRMLESEGYLVVGEAGDAASAVEAARALEPELALVDVCLPDEDGFDLAARLGGWTLRRPW